MVPPRDKRREEFNLTTGRIVSTNTLNKGCSVPIPFMQSYQLRSFSDAGVWCMPYALDSLLTDQSDGRSSEDAKSALASLPDFDKGNVSEESSDDDSPFPGDAFVFEDSGVDNRDVDDWECDEETGDHSPK